MCASSCFQLRRECVPLHTLPLESALSKKTKQQQAAVAAAIARPARTINRCLRGHRKKKREFCRACFDCRLRGEHERRFLKNEYVQYCTRYTYQVCRKSFNSFYRKQYKIYSAKSTYVLETSNSSVWNHIFNFHRRGPPRRSTETAVALPHSRECTRSPYLPN